MKLVRFTEKNVDGCGSDAEVILQIDSDEPVNSKILESVISDIVSETADEYMDTDSIVSEACDRYFRKRNISYKAADVIEIEF